MWFVWVDLADEKKVINLLSQVTFLRDVNLLNSSCKPIIKEDELIEEMVGESLFYFRKNELPQGAGKPLF